MQRIKVIHYIENIHKASGGVTAYLQKLGFIIKNKIEFVIATGTTDTPAEFDDIRIEYFDTKLSNLLILKKQFVTFLKNESPDIIHINGIWPPQNAIFQSAAQKLKIKVILSPHGMLEPYILNRNRFKKNIALMLYQNKALKKANYLHATAESELSQIKKLGFHQSSVVIPNGIDLDEIQEKNWNNTESTRQILFLSRIHPKKGIEILIDTIYQLNYKNNLKLIIAGEGDQVYINKLKNKCSKLGLNNKINFIGGVYGQEKWTIYKSSDLFILPSYSENFGIVIGEALAVGIPVITTTGTPWRELLTYKCGWWVNNDINSLKDAILKALSISNKDLSEMGKNGQELIKNNYDNRIVANKMLNFYIQILNEDHAK